MVLIRFKFILRILQVLVNKNAALDLLYNLFMPVFCDVISNKWLFENVIICLFSILTYKAIRLFLRIVFIYWHIFQRQCYISTVPICDVDPYETLLLLLRLSMLPSCSVVFDFYCIVLKWKYMKGKKLYKYDKLYDIFAANT